MGIIDDIISFFTKTPKNPPAPPSEDACLDWKKKVTQLANEKVELNKTLSAKIVDLQNEIVLLNLEIENSPAKKVDPINFHEQNLSKIKNDYTYPCRGFWQKNDKWKSFQMDLRLFCTPHAKTIVTQASLFNGPKVTNDEKMKKIRDWVRKNIDKSATQDKDVFGVDEYYQYSWETLDLRQSDCDDSGILIRDLAEAAGVPEERLLVLACDSLSSGHMLCIYCRETDNEWVAIDAVYFPTTEEVKNLVRLKLDNRYSNYWWAFNSKNLYKDPIIA